MMVMMIMIIIIIVVQKYNNIIIIATCRSPGRALIFFVLIERLSILIEIGRRITMATAWWHQRNDTSVSEVFCGSAIF